MYRGNCLSLTTSPDARVRYLTNNPSKYTGWLSSLSSETPKLVTIWTRLSRLAGVPLIVLKVPLFARLRRRRRADPFIDQLVLHIIV